MKSRKKNKAKRDQKTIPVAWEYLTSAKAARYLGISKVTLRRRLNGKQKKK